MIAVFSVLTVFTLSIIVIRVATVGLTLTELSKDLARFQAVSAFTGSGFTTRESEDIVNHPVRRRIAMHLMLLGHVGVVVVIPSLILSFINPGVEQDWSGQVTTRVTVLVSGVLLLLLLASSRLVERVAWNANTWALRRWTHLQVHDYTRLLRFSRDYVVSELHVRAEDWLTGHTLLEAKLASEGVLVLGVERANGEYVGAPRGHTRIAAGDCLILYGLQASLLNLDERRTGMEGNVQHVMAVTRHLEELEEEDEQIAADEAAT